MIMFVINEEHQMPNGRWVLNNIRGPYSDDMAAFDHRDKCVAYRASNPTPFEMRFTVHKVLPAGLVQ